ncbi:hypothetical protein LJY25_10760 [Hymenobacter sp. BT175]|uniref:hypothetical protein n=1 Tax=Hymenobacter translucens TaxID=2886507 RepID=UPI001D0EAA83|nr:hypothetical protein [Hymenobacter translucens]MCC2546926.1 hypothetical protein [Hymenobacter translucens]
MRLVPPLAWWALAGLVLGVLNTSLHQELWPNTPGARYFFTSLSIVSGMLLPWLGARTCWRVADTLPFGFWQVLWRLTGVGAYGGACVATLLGLIVLAVKL